MKTVVLIVLLVICAVGWLVSYVTGLTICYYLVDKGYQLPPDEELQECARIVWRHLLLLD